MAMLKAGELSKKWLPPTFKISDLLCDFGSIALVGNSPRLMDGAHGADIDAHDVVVRVNDGRIQGYEPQAGTRTTLRYIGVPLKERYVNFFTGFAEDSLIITRKHNKEVLERIGCQARARFIDRFREVPSEAFRKISPLIDMTAVPAEVPRSGIVLLSLLTDIMQARKKVSLYGFETASREGGHEHFYDDGRAWSRRSWSGSHGPVEIEFQVLNALSEKGYIIIY